jgi:DNA-binding NarL/FixJ family response regulator
MAQKVRILIVDDHPLFRQGIKWSLEAAPDLEVIGEAENGQEAIKLAERCTPDVVPHIGIVVLSVYEDDEQLFQAIKVGAAAYSSKDVHPTELLRLIRGVAAGQYLINDSVLAKPHVANRVLLQFRELAAGDDEQANELFAPLTSREIEILDCIARGLANKEIANELSISSQTVKNHITSILSKLQVNDRTMAVIYAIKRGWIKMGYESSKPEAQP